MKYFLSHASSDDSFLRAFLPVLKEIDHALDEGKDLFYSSNAYAVGVRPGDEVLSSLARAIEEADCVILFLTSDYLRKPFCLYEASLASYFRTKGKKLVVPIAASSSLVAPLEPLFPGLTYVNAEEKGAAERFFSAFDLKGKASPAADAFFSSFASKGTAFSLLPPLGMGKERYLSLFPYLEKSGIERCDDGTPSTLSSLRSTLEGAKDIYFVSTTGSSFLKTNRDLLSAAVKGGANLHIVLGATSSRDLEGVAGIESLGKGEDEARQNRVRLDGEIASSLGFLREIALSADGAGAGKVKAYPAHGLIRQTAFLAEKEGGWLEGWITLTLPPARTADGTPSLVFRGKKESEGKKNLPSLVLLYASSLVEMSERAGDSLDLRAISSPRGLYEKNASSLPVEEAYRHYEEKWAKARKEQDRRDNAEEGSYEGTLIEIAAQHPLREDGTPGGEFRARLDRGYELYWSLVDRGEKAAVYVPGSKHLRPNGKGKADRASLSSAGIAYLLGKERKIPRKCLYGDKANALYMGKAGVYNSADECYAASCLFRDGGFRRLVSVCSPNQLLRKEFFYLEQELLPTMVPVAYDKAFHADFVDEAFLSLLPTLLRDHSWQDPSGEAYRVSREKRMPGFKKD